MKLVVGSNFIAWITAIRLRQLNPLEPVCLLEFGKTYGGNSKSLATPFGTVDLGMQTFFESEVSWANEIVWEAITESQLDVNYFKWPNHDPGLTSQNNELFGGLHPIHNEHWSVKNYETAFVQMVENQGDINKLEDAVSALKRTFGREIYESSLHSIVEKFTCSAPETLSMTSLDAIPLGRIQSISISDEDLLKSPLLRSRIAFKDSALIPRSLVKNSGTIYPKSGGIAALIDTLVSFAQRHGVTTLSNMGGVGISLSKRRLVIEGFEEASEVFWCIQNEQISSLLGLQEISHYSKPVSGSYMVIKSDAGFYSQNAHYLLSYDEDQIFRLTFNGNLAGESSSSLATVEMVVPPQDVHLGDLKTKLVNLSLVPEDSNLQFLEPMPVKWPISYKAGYESVRELEELEIKSEVDGLHLMNSNPAYSSIMQTPTMQLRLSSEILR